MCTFTSSQIITVEIVVYYGEDSIIFAPHVFRNRVFRLFRVTLPHDIQIFRLTYTVSAALHLEAIIEHEGVATYICTILLAKPPYALIHIMQKGRSHTP